MVPLLQRLNAVDTPVPATGNVGIDRNVPQTQEELQQFIANSEFGKSVPASTVAENKVNLENHLATLRETRGTSTATTALEEQTDEYLPILEELTQGLDKAQSVAKIKALVKSKDISKTDSFVLLELLEA